MPPAFNLFGWIPPSQRTKEMNEGCDKALASMPKFSIKGRQRYGKKVALFDWSKEANGGKHLNCFKQIKGSCVGNGLGMALWQLAGVQRVKLGDMISMLLPLWLIPYGKSRELAGMHNKGDGSQGSTAAAAARDFGTPPSDMPEAPKWTLVEGGICFGGPTEIKYSTLAGIDKKLIDGAKPHLCRTVAQVKSADSVRDAIVNGHSVTIASTWGGMMKGVVEEGVLMNKRVTTWPHQMCVLAWWEHDKLGEIFWIQNSWGANMFGVCPSGAPLGGFWVRKADMDFIARQGDSFAFSSFVGYPAQDMELDFYVRRDRSEEDRLLAAGAHVLAV
jgi:hypothetical protein